MLLYLYVSFLAKEKSLKNDIALNQMGQNMTDNIIVYWVWIHPRNSSFQGAGLHCISREAPSNRSIIHSLSRLLTWFLSKLYASSRADGISIYRIWYPCLIVKPHKRRGIAFPRERYFWHISESFHWERQMGTSGLMSIFPLNNQVCLAGFTFKL